MAIDISNIVLVLQNKAEDVNDLTAITDIISLLKSIKTSDEEIISVNPGIITLWNGLSIPSGWALCNGNYGTPNLVSRFFTEQGNDLVYIMKL